MEQFEIAGRKFERIGEGTMRHDVFVMQQVAACGLNVIAQHPGESEEDFQYRLYATAIKTGDIFMLLGSLLVPQGTDALKWTQQMAVETGQFLADVSAPEDKAKLRFLLASVLMPFFLGGRRSSRTSRKSSQPESELAHPTETAEPEILETGTN